MTGLPPLRLSRRRVFVALAAVLVALSWSARPAPAQQPERVPIRAWDHGDYGRLVFDWPAPVGFTARIAGGRVLVTFDRPLIPSLAGVFRQLPGYITTSGLAADGRSVRFELSGPFELRSFASGNSVVVDLLRPVPTGAAAGNEGAASEVIAVRFGEHETYDRMVFDWPVAPDYRLARDAGGATVSFERPARIDLARLRSLLPPRITGLDAESDGKRLVVRLTLPPGSVARGFRSGPKVVIDISRPESAGPAPAKAAGAAAGAPLSAPSSTRSVEGATETAADEAVGRSAPDQAGAGDGAAAPLASAPSPAPLGATVSVRGERLAEGAHLRFDWTNAVAAAVFVRAGYLWTVFDAPAQLSFDLADGAESVIGAAEQVPLKGRTLARFRLTADVHPTVSADGTAWLVDLQAAAEPETRIPVVMEDSSQVGARILLTEEDSGNEIYVIDPEVGDELVIVPSSHPGHGVAPGRSFVDLELLPTAQGIALRAISDSVAVRALRDRVEISSLSGLHLSPQPAGPPVTPRSRASKAGEASENGDAEAHAEAAAPPVELARAAPAALEDVPMFELAKWRRVDGQSFGESKRTHQLELALTPEENRYHARIALAQYYFANGMAVEALGWLRRAVVETPWLDKDPAVRALRGVATLLADRPKEAADDLFAKAFDNNSEMALWRGMYYARTGDLKAAADEFGKSGEVVERYPKRLRSPIRLAAARAALAVGQLGQARAILDRLLIDRPKQRFVDLAKYVRGLITAADGEPLDAIEILSEASQSEDRFTHARAERARIEMMLKEGMISPGEAIDGLEALRFAWRGDDFELRLLHRLGDLYIGEKNYRDGLSTYREAISAFPDFPQVREIAQSMNESFRDLFLGDAAETLPPITVLGIYNDFRELTPVGNLGDQLIYRLADRLVGVDLLEQAAALLEHQIRFRLRGGELARVGARLAEIQLLNKRPDAAVNALRASDVVRMSDDLAARRHYLLGRALAESGDYDKAQVMLRGDQSEEANLLRADIYWAKKDWPAEATVLGQILRDRDPNAPLGKADVQHLIKMAVALALSNNRPALEDLRRRYGALIDDTDKGKAFRTIASYVDGGPVDVAQISSAVAQIDTYEAFLASLRERVAGESLSAIN